jgi:hypothetical protein
LELGSYLAPFFPKFLYKNWRKFMINFEVSKHLFLDGLHLKTEFENGYEISIVPSQIPFGINNFRGNPERVELGIFFQGTMISTFSDEDLTFLSPTRALEICEEVKDLNPNI